MPDISTKGKGKQYIGLDIDAKKRERFRKRLSGWLEKSEIKWSFKYKNKIVRREQKPWIIGAGLLVIGALLQITVGGINWKSVCLSG